MEKICENCKRKIQPKEHYYEVIEYFNKEVLSKKWVHKNCQDNYNEKLKNSLQTNLTARQFIRNANQFMKDIGAKEVVTIQ